MGCQGCNDSATSLCMPVDKCKMHTSSQSSVQPAHATHTHFSWSWHCCQLQLARDEDATKYLVA